jgi:hypothetical protein
VAERSARFTDSAELVVYLVVQAAGLVWNFTVGAAIAAGRTARGHRDPLSATVADSIATAIVVLVLFLLLRWLLAKAGRGQSRPLADLREIGAYLLAQVIGFILAIFVMMPVLGALYHAGVQNLSAASFALNIVLILVELPIFLFLRRRMTANVERASRSGAAGFGFGLAFITWVAVALTIGSDRGMSAGTTVSERLPWLFDICVAAGLAAWAGGSVAYVTTAFVQTRSWRAALMTIIAPSIALPSVAALTMGLFYGVCAGQVTMGWIVRTGMEKTAHAVLAGGVAFAAPTLLATFLWALYYLRPSPR